VDLSIFRNMGLEDREAKIYLSVLGTGPSRASSIAAGTRIDRTVVYKLLGRLIEKGFVSYDVRENRRYFQAKDPMELMGLLDERRLRFQEALPELQKMQKPISEEVKAEVFRGKKGLQALLNDMLREMGEKAPYKRPRSWVVKKPLVKDRVLYGLGEIMATLEKAGPWYDKWVQRRVHSEVEWRYLANPESHEKLIREGLFETRFLPEGFNLPNSMIIYGNKTLTFYPDGQFVGTLITSSEVAGENKAFFHRMWREAKA